MQHAKASYAVLALMLATSMPSHAQSVGELANLQAETLILKARAAKAEAQASLDAALAKSSGAGASGLASEDPTLPVVKGVYGSGRLIANLLFADGSTMEVSEGDGIPGGFTVRKVSVDRVELGRRGKGFPLGFSQIKPMVQAMAPAAPMGPPGMAMPAPFLPSVPTGSGKSAH